jgi:hypothetical protein
MIVATMDVLLRPMEAEVTTVARCHPMEVVRTRDPCLRTAVVVQPMVAVEGCHPMVAEAVRMGEVGDTSPVAVVTAEAVVADTAVVAATEVVTSQA